MSLTVPQARPGVIPAPRDRLLTALPTALSASAMEQVLAETLGDAVGLRACVPVYIRYKPETSCIVQYRLTAEDSETGQTHKLGAHVKLFAGDRAERVWAKGAAQRLAATATEWSDDGPSIERAAYLPDLGALLQVFPVDIALPALAFTGTSAGRDHVVDRLLPASPQAPGDIELVRYKPARKALLRYETPERALYVKLHAGEKAEPLFRAVRTLAAAGVPLVSPLGCIPSLNLLAHVEEKGTPLNELRDTREYEAGVRAAGEALARLHAVAPPPDIPPHTTAHQAALVADSARTVAVLCPELGEAVAACAEDVIARLGDLPPAATTLHGDFYDDQVLLRDGRATLLDLDGIRLGQPLVDVGNFLAHLAVRDLGDPARAAFLEGYGVAPGPAVALMETAALLRLAVAPFRRLEPDWPAGVEKRLVLAASCLAGAAGQRRRRPERRLDPTLPQLALLRNPALVQPPLSEELGTRVRVDDVAVVRHKRGRRCTLRYTLTLEGNDEPLRLYAKTFARERGPRVFRTLETIAEGWSRPAGVAMPEPVAYLRSCKLLLLREVRGRPARARFLAGDQRLAARAAEALAGLHQSAVCLARVHGLEDELATVRSRVERLGQEGPRAKRCLAKLETALAAPWAWRTRPVHRDVYHDQLLVDGDALGILDFDDAKMSEPAVDVANFLAHLRLLAIQEPARAEVVHAAAEAFRGRAHKLDPELDPGLTRLLESATLLRLAGIHDLHAGRLVDEATTLLSPGRRTAPPLPGRTELALDGPAVLELVADAIDGWAGVRPTECRPVLLHRKKGRTVVRYDLQTEGAPLAVVGKWFGTNARSGEVAEVLAALRQQGFADERFAVPEPIFHDPAIDLLVTDFTPGPSVRSLLDLEPAAAGRAGAWLARLHTCAVRLRRSFRPAALTTTLSDRKDGDFAGLAARVDAALEALPDPVRPLHFDYTGAAVLVPENGPTVAIDLDDAAMGDPAFDVANFEATLRLRGWRGLAEPRSIRAATVAFRRGYAEHGPLPAVVPAIEAAVWLRLAHRAAARRVGDDIFRFALDRAADALERSDA